MRLAVVGMGLVSPVGLTASDHAFFVRAGVARAQRSPFRLASGDPLPVRYCPVIGARAPIAPRLGRLGGMALADALRPLEGVAGFEQIPILICTSAPRPGLSAAERGEAARAIAAARPGAEVERLTGAAGFFAGLREAEERIARGRAPAVALVAADSLIAGAALAARVARPPSPWTRPSLPAGEGAAALVLADPDRAARPGSMGGAMGSAIGGAIGFVRGAAVVRGTSSDDDDEIVDGAAMTEALRALPAGPKIRAAYGQSSVDALRRDEWFMAVARCAARFDPEHEALCIEEETGEAGAAAGAMSLVHGLAAARHGTTRTAEIAASPLIAWAISRDGTRGLALAEANEP